MIFKSIREERVFV